MFTEDQLPNENTEGHFSIFMFTLEYHFERCAVAERFGAAGRQARASGALQNTIIQAIVGGIYSALN